MVIRRTDGALTKREKRVVKALLAKGLRNQDIQAQINLHRKHTINGARISEVKASKTQDAASDEEVEFFQLWKNAYDPQTGLNFYENERLIRAREAMILAVQIFNSPALRFKTEVFVVLSNIAWMYLLHEYFETRGIAKITDADGWAIPLSAMITHAKCPLSEGVKNNLEALKIIRDQVEHTLLGKADAKWLGLFQASCLNFDRELCKHFGKKLTLANDLSFALQFSKLNMEQISAINKYEIPGHIQAIDARLSEGKTEAMLADLDYNFRVVYTLDAASKGKAHFEFVRPDSAEGKEIRNVLVQYKAGDEFYPHKPTKVAKLVQKGLGRTFTSTDHAHAWRFFGARPPGDAKQPENTNKDWCMYHVAHGDYTYSDKWVAFLTRELADEALLKRMKLTKAKSVREK